jgi:hypothetical protein
MPDDSLGDKLGRQYEKLKSGLKDIAQKVTAEDTEPRTDAMAGRKSGARSQPAAKRTRGAKAGLAAKTKEELYADARRLGVKGRSKMTKDELAKAVRRS